jgi:hypothetical protein
MCAQGRTAGVAAVMSVFTAVGVYAYVSHHSQARSGDRVEMPAPRSVDMTAVPPSVNPTAVSPAGRRKDAPIAESNTAAAVGTSNEWTVSFRNSQDYFQFVANATQAALAGDGRAAMHITEVLETCNYYVDTYRSEIDPEASFVTGLADMIGVEQWFRDGRLDEFRRCWRFFEGEPFLDLPPRTGGYSVKYWRELANSTDDPLVKVLQAARQPVMPSSDARTAAAARRAIQADLRAAITSKDPDALYSAGMLLADGRLSADPLRGVAWVMVACDSGYDCSVRHAHNVYSLCAQVGTCPPDKDWHKIQRALDPDSYARAHAMAEEFKKMMARNDWDRLQPYWTPDAPYRHPSWLFSPGDQPTPAITVN